MRYFTSTKTKNNAYNQLGYVFYLEHLRGDKYVPILRTIFFESDLFKQGLSSSQQSLSFASFNTKKKNNSSSSKKICFEYKYYIQ